MAEPIKFTELTNAGELSLSAIMAIVQQQAGELVSLQCSMAQVAELVASGVTYQELTTEQKTLISAINEIAAGGGGGGGAYFFAEGQATAAQIRERYNSGLMCFLIANDDTIYPLTAVDAEYIQGERVEGVFFAKAFGYGDNISVNVKYIQNDAGVEVSSVGFTGIANSRITSDMSATNGKIPTDDAVRAYVTEYIRTRLGQKLDLDLNNISAAGEQKIRDIAGGGGGGGDVTKAYVDEQNALQDAEITKNKDTLTELKLTVESNTDRIDVLEKMSKGILYDFVTQTVEGTQNIPKGSHLADIQKLEGKSVVWNQHGFPIENGYWSLKNTRFSISNGAITGTASYRYDGFLSENPIEIPVNHKVLFMFLFKGSAYLQFTQQSGFTNLFAQPLVADDFKLVTSITTLTKSIDSKIRIQDNIESDFKEFSIKNLMIFDLTQMFGAGNEPTKEQFEAMFPNDYYPYNAGELQSVDNSKMVVKGKNLFDATKAENGYISDESGAVNGTSYTDTKNTGFIEIKANTKYYIAPMLSSGNWGAFYDSQKNFIKGITGYGNIHTSPSNAKYVRLTVSYNGSNIDYENNFLFAESEITTEYSPYITPTEIPLAFVGKSAGTVRDELDLVNKKYIQRVGVVDIGSLNWDYDTVNKIFHTLGTNLQSFNFISDIKYQLTAIVGVANMIDKSYHIRPINEGYDGNIYLKDINITEVSSLKVSLSGVMLYYELAEPIVTDVSTVIDSFEVEGNGSIEFDSTIPVKNTIEYLRYLNEV